ncbi:ABC transporter ATP-binding protein [Mucilaginibacter sp. X4EP1]|uniref:ABC transporter ATP-binding protein n=1 Tax=Mucilaginibacter sp. X4EP1 TaxID=2723092 RepID=UPI00216A467A|nr:ATP-binding cassette domain-containing protein [Mucilaginibacter sp. X4EP1]MCS3812872.1 ABC-2 type transport system ATP-binding protein [Mucilaginibacter sp. X4EP1]
MKTADGILKLHNISKTYGDKKVLDGITLDIPEGAVFGVLGPNGSGKTTLLGIVLDVIKCDGGYCEWVGNGAGKFNKMKVGSLLETPNFYPYLNAEQNLKITALIKQSDYADIAVVLNQLDLTASKKKMFSTYSLGMKQRLAIAACLIGNPEIIILDEPTNGLDPEGLADVRALIKHLHAHGKTIIVASHLLDEIEKICTHVAVLNKGKLVASGTVKEVFNYPDIIEVSSKHIDHLCDALQQFHYASKITREGNMIRVFFREDELHPERLFRFCAEKGIDLNHLQVVKNNMEQSFFDLIKAS